MSRVGKLPVAVPEGVQVEFKDGTFSAKGKLGELTTKIDDKAVNVSIKDNAVTLSPANDSDDSKAKWGTYRSIINNIVTGVAEGFTINLEMKGVGYRAQVEGNIINLSLGYSHDIKYAFPEGISIKVVKQTSLIISGSDKQKVGQIAGEIMKLRPVEPYKGKGVYIEGSYIRRKEGKKK